MKTIALLVILFTLPGDLKWHTDFETASRLAKEEHKLILLNFSGSDWCGPCIRLHKTYFEAPAFLALATEELVLVNADFPRLKKNRLSPDQQKKNDALAEQYNKNGSFPLTLLLDEKGKVLKTWEGIPSTSQEEFVAQIKALHHASK